MKSKPALLILISFFRENSKKLFKLNTIVIFLSVKIEIWENERINKRYTRIL